MKRCRQGAWRVNTAQALIILIALVCLGVVYSTYQQANTPPMPLSQTNLTAPDARQKRYAQQIARWQAKLSRKQMTLTWPYLGHDFVARVDLPDKTPVTLTDWDPRSQARAAHQAYLGFVRARKDARVPDSATCIVHVFDAAGEEVAQASASGVVTSAQQPIGPG